MHHRLGKSRPPDTIPDQALDAQSLQIAPQMDFPAAGRQAREVFRAPMLLGLATAVGLVSALLGDGVWDALSWLTILAPVVAVVMAWRRRT